MQQFIPYLMFNGNCAQAMRFYESAIGAKVDAMMTFADSPMAESCAPQDRGLIMHAAISIGDSMLMASDVPPGQPYEGQKGVAVALSFDTVAQAQKVFDALAAGGQTTMPMGETFWAQSFGMATDRFGTSWMVSGAPKPM